MVGAWLQWAAGAAALAYLLYEQPSGWVPCVHCVPPGCALALPLPLPLTAVTLSSHWPAQVMGIIVSEATGWLLAVNSMAVDYSDQGAQFSGR